MNLCNQTLNLYPKMDVLDVDYEILLRMDLKDLLKSCSLNKNFHAICNDELFWKEKSDSDYPGIRKPVDLKYRDFYIKMYRNEIKQILVRVSVLNEIVATSMTMQAIAERSKRANVTNIWISKTDTGHDVIEKAINAIRDGRDISDTRSIGFAYSTGTDTFVFPMDISRYIQLTKTINWNINRIIFIM